MATDELLNQLRKYFGHAYFRSGQQEIIQDVMNGRDVLGILPTGVGKSLCFQLPALLNKGVTIVISPLISLMVDQVKQLKAKGFKAVIALNSFMDLKERSKELKQLDKYRLIYLSPELLQNPRVTLELKKLHVQLFVVDEAHCISQWGHEFRTDYLKLSQKIAELGNPPVLALSATATPEVQKDIKQQLDKPDMTSHINQMDKPNMSFSVEQFLYPEDKAKRIISIAHQKRTPTMIYFSSRSAAEQLAEELTNALEQRVAFYHGGMENMDRLLVQQQFMKDELDIICCTSAFGMGVDKPNIRRVIHYHFPAQIESFIQEIGRAGRDGQPCASLVLHTPNDQVLPQLLLEKEVPREEDVRRVFSWLSQNSKLPSDEEMLEKMNLSESQWNFLKFHLEHVQIIINGEVRQEDKLEAFRPEIIKRLNKRWKYKNHKYKQMLDWVLHKGCRRDRLYMPFQKGTAKPLVECCDYCGFSIDDLDIQKDSSNDSENFSSWKDRLDAVFLQEYING